ncbi:hypothetical protein HYFRA_00006626 [Hymenoscyphus fraxineus]|uniref:Cytochrome P450 n=1 Tax=Hymenoscyphus fraxineus TaxID=746836 RepID=A0A9N9PNN4_9HELO|nr:hypothetical protein HYFRA_00006626 [Hymenoscyphus fraxineus]
MGILFNLGLLLAVLMVYKKVKSFLIWRAFEKWGDERGCGKPPVYPNILPWGLERYKIAFTGTKGIDILEDTIRSRYTKIGAPTHRLYNVGRTLIHTSTPENIQALLATNFQDYELGAARTKNLSDLIGNGIFTAEGESWAHFRHQLRPQFTREQVSDLETARKHLEILFRAVPNEDEEGWVETDLMPLIYRFTLDASTEFLFGESADSQSSALAAIDSGNTTDSQREMDFSEAMRYAQETIMLRLRFKSLYWIISSKKFSKACKTVQDFADRSVAKVLDANHKRAATVPGQKTKHIFLEELATQTQDPIEIRDQALQLLLAGRDTTASLLSWSIALLARHPSDFQRIRASVIDLFGTYQEPKEEMTFSSLKSCKELTYLFYETLRLYPVVPMNSRRAIRNTILPTGGGPDGKLPVAVMKGEGVAYSTYVLHRRHDTWGEDADEFRPGRWVGRKLGWEYIPFSGGARVCIGQQYALNEASFVVARLLQRYDRIESIDPEPLRKEIAMSLILGNGVKVKMHRAVD